MPNHANSPALLCTIALIFFSVSLLFSTAYAETATKGQFLGAMDTEYPSWFKQSFLDLNEDIDEAKKANKRVMIFFHQDGCPYCNALVERNLSQKHIKEFVQKHFDVLAINMWGDREVADYDGTAYTEKTFAAAKRVQFTPTLLFYNERGEVILRLNGYRAPERFLLDLEYIANRLETTTDYRQYIHAKTTSEKSSTDIHPLGNTVSPLSLANLKDKPIAVFFEQKDCPNCDYLHQEVLPSREIQGMLERFHVVQLDMWKNTELVTQNGKKTTAREWAKELNIEYAPSIVLFDTSGLEVIRLEAHFKSFHTAGILDYVLSGKYKSEPSFQRFLSERAEHIREQGKDVDIWRTVK